MDDPAWPLRHPRVDKWLSRRGRGLPALTVDGAALLDRRLAIRRRAAAAGVGVFTLSVVAWVASMASANLEGDGLLLVATMSATALWELVHAPALAVDEGTLADERLRRQNVYSAIYPLVGLSCAVATMIGLIDGTTNHRLDRVAMRAQPLVFVPVLVLDRLAQLIEERERYGPARRRWRTST